MARMTLTVPMCAVLYLIYSGTTKKSDIQKKYGITKMTIYRLIGKGLISSTRKGKYVYLSLTPLGEEILRKNEDICRQAVEVIKLCRERNDLHACEEVQHGRLSLSL